MYEIQDVDNVAMVFGADAMKLMPAYSDIPEVFKRSTGFWQGLVSDWFFMGLSNLNLNPKDGVDTSKALRHITTILGSFEPQHEHKEAGVAFLLSEWFHIEGSIWDTAKKTLKA